MMEGGGGQGDGEERGEGGGGKGRKWKKDEQFITIYDWPLFYDNLL